MFVSIDLLGAVDIFHALVVHSASFHTIGTQPGGATWIEIPRIVLETVTGFHVLVDWGKVSLVNRFRTAWTLLHSVTDTCASQPESALWMSSTAGLEKSVILPSKGAPTVLAT